MLVRRNSTICQADFFLSKLPYSSSELLRRIVSPASDGGDLNDEPGVLGANSRSDQYFDARTTLDLAATYTFCHGLGVYFNIKNLTDAPCRIYEGNRNRVIQQEYDDLYLRGGNEIQVLINGPATSP
jgi:hypothetical protein